MHPTAQLSVTDTPPVSVPAPAGEEFVFAHPRARVAEDGSLEIWQVPAPIAEEPRPFLNTTTGTIEMSNADVQPINPADFGYGPQVLKSLSEVDAKMHVHANPPMPTVSQNALVDGLKIQLFRMTCDELVKKGLKPGTRNFRRMFKKRTTFTFDQMQADVIEISKRVRAMLAAQEAANPTADPVEAVAEQLNAETAAGIHDDKVREGGLVLDTAPTLSDSSGDATVIEHLADRPDTIAGLDTVFGLAAHEAAGGN